MCFQRNKTTGWTLLFLEKFHRLARVKMTVNLSGAPGNFHLFFARLRSKARRGIPVTSNQ